jgi:hypothetical protein
MADIDLQQGNSLPSATLTKYKDMGDGTHALTLALGADAGEVDVSDRLGRLVGRITNYDVLANGTLGGLNAVLPINASGLGVMGMGISGTWAGTIVVEGNMGDGVWDNIPLIDSTLGSASLTTVSNGSWLIGIAGYLSVRARMSLYTSGTATIYLEGTSASAGVFLSRSIPTGGNLIGSVLLAAGTNEVGSLSIPATWASAAVSGNTSGDNELVALVAGQSIYVVGITLVGAAAVNVVLESGTAGPDLTGLMAIAAAGGSIVMPVTARGWYCKTDVGESLNMRLDGAVFVTGIVTYYTA